MMDKKDISNKGSVVGISCSCKVEKKGTGYSVKNVRIEMNEIFECIGFFYV